MGHFSASALLGSHTDTFTAALDAVAAERMIARIWARDYTVWRPEPKEIVNRLGWLDIAARVKADLARLLAFRDALLVEGFTDVLLLGMGGSSLAPEVLSKVFGGSSRGLRLAVLDSTDADTVRSFREQLDLARTLFLVATKSGGTVETMSFAKYFYNETLAALGAEAVAAHFAAITDAGSGLHELAQALGFREIFLNDPEIGGRYSALSYFGMSPAALIGLDVERLLERALEMTAACSPEVPIHDNPAAWLGAALGGLARAGLDKITLVGAPQIASFGDWVEQLVAESTGKEGKGVLPVVGEPLGAPEMYGADRVFVHLPVGGPSGHEAALDALSQAGFPVLTLPLRDAYDLGAQFFLWGMATAVASALIGIQPFDQPNVESAKVVARRLVKTYQETGALPPMETNPMTLEALESLLTYAQPGGYIAIQAYIPPSPETEAALQQLRLWLLERTHLATTLGFGPRFLHSTGQLHKGDAGRGLFLQLTSSPEQDVPIPDVAGAADSSITFGVLKLAQAFGDRQALLEAGRHVLTFHLGTDVVTGLAQLNDMLRKTSL